MSVVAALHALGGVARARDLVRPGVDHDDLRRAERAGSIVRVRHGVYALAGTPLPVVAAAAHGGSVGCTSALRLHGVWVLDSDVLHVRLGAKGRSHPHDGCRCVDHHGNRRTVFGIASVVDALVQAALCAGPEVFFTSFESAWRLGLLSRADRVEIRGRLPARLRRYVDIARGDADSGLESLLRLRLGDRGIRLECQVLVSGVGRVDFVLAGRIILEVDGRLNHDGPSLRHKDLVRDAAAAAAGYETLRFDYALIVHDWPRVEAAILARLPAQHSEPQASLLQKRQTLHP
jgi:very-short-patch-repair endonuclease